MRKRLRSSHSRRMQKTIRGGVISAHHPDVIGKDFRVMFCCYFSLITRECEIIKIMNLYCE